MSFTSEISDRPHQPDRVIPVPEVNAFHAWSRAFGLPAQLGVNDAELLATVFGGLESDLQISGQRASQALKDALHQNDDALAAAYARLFLGPFEILASPYASFYLEPHQQIMGEVSRYVANEYAGAGLLPQANSREAPDHICCELEFMYFLAFQFVATGQTVWLDRQRRFWSGHLRHWLPAFCDQIIQAEVHPFYSAIGTLLRQFANRQAIL